VKDDPLSVAASIGSLNVALTFPLVGVPTAPSKGALDMTVGADPDPPEELPPEQAVAMDSSRMAAPVPSSVDCVFVMTDVLLTCFLREF
jgi:hypothetical protein